MCRLLLHILVVFTLFHSCFTFTSDNNYASDEDGLSFVTFGSLIKLRHVDMGCRLHSHEVNYGGGSKQQSVTCVDAGDDVNSFWIVKEPHGQDLFKQGTPIKHGDKFRLQHTTTGKNMHSHTHRAPLSDGYEVSCYGNQGNGDEGDNWELEVPQKTGYWKRGESVRIRHVVDGTYLASHNRAFQRPIAGQKEVKAITKKRDSLCLWKSEEGVYFEANWNSDEE